MTRARGRRGPPQTKERRVSIKMIPYYDVEAFDSQRGIRGCSAGGSCLIARFAYDEWPYIEYECNMSADTLKIRHPFILDDETVLMNVEYDQYSYEVKSALRRELSLCVESSDAVGIMFVYDTTNPVSWEGVKLAVDDAFKIAMERDPAVKVKGRFMIVGCKSDLVEQRAVDFKAVQEYAHEKGILCIETSAKDNVNVEYAFISFAAHLLEIQKVQRL